MDYKALSQGWLVCASRWGFERFSCDHNHDSSCTTMSRLYRSSLSVKTSHGVNITTSIPKNKPWTSFCCEMFVRYLLRRVNFQKFHLFSGMIEIDYSSSARKGRGRDYHHNCFPPICLPLFDYYYYYFFFFFFFFFFLGGHVWSVQICPYTDIPILLLLTSTSSC